VAKVYTSVGARLLKIPLKIPLKIVNLKNSFKIALKYPIFKLPFLIFAKNLKIAMFRIKKAWQQHFKKFKF
jgi:hypothetical protein